MRDSKLEDTRLVFTFAHDVRTYLRTVLTRIQLVQNSAAAVLPREDQSMLQEAVSAARSIDGLLSAMVAYCDGNTDEGTENLRLLLRGVLIERKAALGEVGAELQFPDTASDHPDVPVPVGLKTVLKELLTNACRFRSAGRPLRILVSSRIVPAGVEISVSDNGVGVDRAYLEKIFAPFYRLHSRDEFPGYGLGLAICRRIVEGWGGTIAAEPAPEQGLTVRITVPVS
jgi:signal transduction histidine kinase